MATHDITQATFKVKKVGMGDETVPPGEIITNMTSITGKKKILSLRDTTQGLNKGPNTLCCCITTPFSIM